MPTVSFIVNYCDRMGLPCELCAADGSCMADECTEGYITEDEDDQQ